MRTGTQQGYDFQWELFEGYCSKVHRPRVDRLLLASEVVQRLGPLVAAARAEIVLIGFLGWMACLLKDPSMTPGGKKKSGTELVGLAQAQPASGPAYHYKATTLIKYFRNVKRRIEEECGLSFGGGYVPSLVKLPRVCKGIVAHRDERTMERLAVAPQHLLAIADNIGIVLTARQRQGPLVTFKQDFPTRDKQAKLAYFGACLDGFLLTMRCMEFTSKSATKFDCMTELSRADVLYNKSGGGHLHTKRYKGDKRHVWPAKILAPAVGGRLCCMAVRRLYEHLNPVPVGTDPSRVPYWQLADGSAVTRERLQQFIQSHMSILGLDASVYKTHSLRKGGVTAMLAAGVSLPQIQLMARWSSPNMAKLYAQLVTTQSATILGQLGRMDNLSLTDCEDRFWTAYTAERHCG